MDRFSFFFCGLFRLSSDHVRGDDPFYPTRSSNASFVPARAFVDVADHDSFRVRVERRPAERGDRGVPRAPGAERTGGLVHRAARARHSAAHRPAAHPRSGIGPRCPETILVRPAGPAAPAPSRIADMAAPRATRVYAVTGTGTGTGPVR